MRPLPGPRARSLAVSSHAEGGGSLRVWFRSPSPGPADGWPRPPCPQGRPSARVSQPLLIETLGHPTDRFPAWSPLSGLSPNKSPGGLWAWDSNLFLGGGVPIQPTARVLELKAGEANTVWDPWGLRAQGPEHSPAQQDPHARALSFGLSRPSPQTTAETPRQAPTDPRSAFPGGAWRFRRSGQHPTAQPRADVTRTGRAHGQSLPLTPPPPPRSHPPWGLPASFSKCGSYKHCPRFPAGPGLPRQARVCWAECKCCFLKAESLEANLGHCLPRRGRCRHRPEASAQAGPRQDPAGHVPCPVRSPGWMPTHGTTAESSGLTL